MADENIAPPTGAYSQTTGPSPDQNDIARTDQAQLAGQLRDAQYAASQEVNAAKAALSKEQEAARQQLKQTELELTAWEKQEGLRITSLAQSVEQERQQQALQISQVQQQIEEGSGWANEMSAKIRNASVYSVSPWTRPDRAQITPPPMPGRR